jgi:hypothetical protein
MSNQGIIKLKMGVQIKVSHFQSGTKRNKGKSTRYVSQNKFITQVHFQLIRPSSGVQSMNGISRKCAQVINLFCETYLVLFSFFPWIEDVSPSSLKVKEK